MSDSKTPEQQLQSILKNISVGGNLTTGDISQILNLFVIVHQPNSFIPKSTPYNIPSSNTIKFVGRADALEQVHQALQQNSQVAITAIEGMGGVGKTELATQYSLLHLILNTYPGGICWLRARDEDIGIQILRFAEAKLGIKPPENWEIKNQVDFCWSRWQEKKEGNVLIVLDDVNDYPKIQSYLPPQLSQFKVLITTRLQLDLPQSFSLDILSESASIELLGQWIGEEKVNEQLTEAKELCLRLGYLPLALNLVGRYVKKRKIFLAEMLLRLEKKGLQHPALDVDQKDRTRTLNIQRGVDAALELSWKELSENAQKLGCLLSLFALAPIPWWLVEKVKIGLEKEDLEQAREELQDFSLLQGKEIYKLHQLIRDFFKNKLENFSKSNKYKNSFSRAMIIEGKKIDPQNLGKYIFIIPHVLVARTWQPKISWFLILSTLLGGIIIVIIIYFLNPWNILGRTTREEENKLKSQQLAAQAKEGSLDRRLLLSATAYKIYPTKEAVKSVFEAWHQSQNLVTYLRDEETQIIRGLMFTDNNKTLISVSKSTIDSASGKVLFWDIKNHQNTSLKYKNTLTAIAFNEKAGIIALGDYKGGVTIVDIEKRQFKGNRIKISDGILDFLEFNQDGTKLIAKDTNDYVNIYNLESNQYENNRLLLRSSEWIGFDDSSNNLTLVNSNGSVYSFDLTSGERSEILSNQYSKIQQWLRTTKVDSEQSKLAGIGLNTGEVFIWDLKNNLELLARSLNGQKNVSTVTFDSEGKTLAMANSKGVISFIDLKKLTALSPSVQAHNNLISSIAFSDDGQTVAFGDAKGTISIWKVNHLASRNILTEANKQTEETLSMAFCQQNSDENKTSVAIGKENNQIVLWDMQTKKEQVIPIDGLDDRPASMACNLDSKLLAVAPDSSNQIFVKDLTSGSVYTTTFTSISPFATLKLSFAKDGTLIIVPYGGEKLIQWNPVKDQNLPNVPIHNVGITSITISKDGTLALGLIEGKIKLQSIDNSLNLDQNMRLERGLPRALTFNHEGNILASGQDTGQISLWDIQSQQLIGNLKNSNGFLFSNNEIVALAFTPDNKYLLAGEKNGLIYSFPAHPEEWIDNICPRIRLNLSSLENINSLNDNLPEVCP